MFVLQMSGTQLPATQVYAAFEIAAPGLWVLAGTCIYTDPHEAFPRLVLADVQSSTSDGPIPILYTSFGLSVHLATIVPASTWTCDSIDELVEPCGYTKPIKVLAEHGRMDDMAPPIPKTKSPPDTLTNKIINAAFRLSSAPPRQNDLATQHETDTEEPTAFLMRMKKLMKYYAL